MLALVMMMLLAVPATAKGNDKAKGPSSQSTSQPAYKIDGAAYGEGFFEAGAKADVSGCSEIYVKQARSAVVWVPADDPREDLEITAQARANDRSLANGTDTIMIIRGSGEVTIIPPGGGSRTMVSVENGILTIVGAISHVASVGRDVPEFEPVTPEDAGRLNVSVGAVVENYIVETHEPVYEYYEMPTLVSDANSAHSLDCVTGSNVGASGMPWLTINKAALEAEPSGVTIGIAASDPQNTPAPAMQGMDVPPSFHLEIDDGRLVVTSELPNIGVRLYTADEYPSGTPGDLKGPYATNGHLAGETATALPIPEGERFMFFLHIEDSGYYTNEVIGCRVVSTEIRERTYACDLTMTVTNEAGEAVYSGDVKEGLSLRPGMYTVTVTASANGEASGGPWFKTVEVRPGETADVDFGKLAVAKMGETVIVCPLCSPCGPIQ